MIVAVLKMTDLLYHIRYTGVSLFCHLSASSISDQKRQTIKYPTGSISGCGSEAFKVFFSIPLPVTRIGDIRRQRALHHVRRQHVVSSVALGEIASLTLRHGLCGSSMIFESHYSLKILSAQLTSQGFVSTTYSTCSLALRGRQKPKKSKLHWQHRISQTKYTPGV